MAFFMAGAPMAASQRFGGSETDVFSIGVTGQIGVSWVTPLGELQQPLPITLINAFPPAGYLAAIQQFGIDTPQTDVFAVDVEGALNVLYAGPPGSSYRRLKISASGIYPPGSPLAAAGQLGGSKSVRPLFKQTDLFIMGPDGGLNVHFAGEGFWDVVKVGPRGIAAPGTPLAAGVRTIKEGYLEVAVGTYLFFVDGNGALNAYSVDASGLWQTEVISAQGTFAQTISDGDRVIFPGTYLAASQQFGTAQLDVFAVDSRGTLNVFSTSGAGWVNQKIRPDIALTAGAPLTASQQFITGADQTDVMIFDPSGTMNIFSVQGAGAWSWKTVGPGRLVPPALLCQLASSRQFASPNINSMRLDVFFINNANQLEIFWVVENETWQRTVLADQAELPSDGIGSYSNFELHNNCDPIIGLEVSILITEDIRADQGIAFQLNCAPVPGDYLTWQQFFFTSPPGSDPPAIKWGVNGWADANGENPINDGAVLLTLPATTTPGVIIPAGYRFVLQLSPLQGKDIVPGVIGGANYTIYDPSGNEAANFLLNLKDEISHTTNKKIKVSQLTPIIGFQLDIVGWMNAAYTTLTSGAGVITYVIPPTESIQPLDGGVPCLDQFTMTGEGSNTSYQTVAVGATSYFTQAFQGLPISYQVADKPILRVHRRK